MTSMCANSKTMIYLKENCIIFMHKNRKMIQSDIYMNNISIASSYTQQNTFFQVSYKRQLVIHVQKTTDRYKHIIKWKRKDYSSSFNLCGKKTINRRNGDCDICNMKTVHVLCKKEKKITFIFYVILCNTIRVLQSVITF